MPLNKLGIKKKFALSLYARYRNNAARLHELSYIFWECTLRCNMSCLHCGSDCLASAVQPDMPLGDFLGALDKLSPNIDPGKTTIALTGGEPLLREDLADCGREFMRRGYNWGFVTSGFLLTESKLKELLDAGLRSITISLDGLAENHNWLRGRENSFDRALAAIKLVAATPGLTYDVATTVHQRSIKELEEVYSLLLEAGVKRWRLFTIFPKGRAAEHAELLPDKVLLFKLFDFIKEKRAEGRMSVYFGCEGYLGEFEGEVRDGFFFCRAGVNIISVLADGSISACPSLRADFIQGDIYRDNIWEIWENRFHIMRDRRWTRVGECRDCKEYKRCGGGALHLRDENTKEYIYCALKEMER